MFPEIDLTHQGLSTPTLFLQNNEMFHLYVGYRYGVLICESDNDIGHYVAYLIFKVGFIPCVREWDMAFTVRWFLVAWGGEDMFIGACIGPLKL